jgi:CheY-like chemotaxis protein
MGTNIQRTFAGVTAESSGENPDHLKPSTVLIAEDEVLVRMVIADYLRDCGYHVIEVANADEALAVLKTETKIDVVFSDVQLPGGLDGFGLARWLRSKRPEVRIILTSGVTKTAREAGDLCEHGPFMAKPYEVRDVESRIKQLLANS